MQELLGKTKRESNFMHINRPSSSLSEVQIKGSEVAFALMLGLTAVSTFLSVCMLAYTLIFANGDGYYLSWYYLLSLVAFSISGVFALITLLIQFAMPRDHKSWLSNTLIQIGLITIALIPVSIAIWMKFVKY